MDWIVNNDKNNWSNELDAYFQTRDVEAYMIY